MAFPLLRQLTTAFKIGVALIVLTERILEHRAKKKEEKKHGTQHKKQTRHAKKSHAAEADPFHIPDEMKATAHEDMERPVGNAPLKNHQGIHRKTPQRSSESGAH